MPELTTATVLGTGAWGTTFAAVLADAGLPVRIWGRSPEVCAEITEHHRNSRYLPDVVLPAGITATTDLTGAVRGSELVVVAVPSQTVRDVLRPLAGTLGGSTVMASLVKGLELGSDLRMSQVIVEATGVPEDRVAVVSGPNLAKEIAARQPTATVIASTSAETASAVAHACANSYFRPYTHADVVGVELGGVVKNVIALAVGVAQGRGYGDNTTATVITRGLAETTRLGVAMGARPETFAGLAGMGDLVATCSSRLSRNHTLGRHIGQGMTVAEATAATEGTAEGARSCRAVLELAERLGVDVPITRGVAAVVHGGLSVTEMTERLLARPRRSEVD